MRPIEGRLIFAIILVDDLFLVVYLALLSPVIGGTEGATEVATSIAISFAFLAGLASIGRWGAQLGRTAHRRSRR